MTFTRARFNTHPCTSGSTMILCWRRWASAAQKLASTAKRWWKLVCDCLNWHWFKCFVAAAVKLWQNDRRLRNDRPSTSNESLQPVRRETEITNKSKSNISSDWSWVEGLQSCDRSRFRSTTTIIGKTLPMASGRAVNFCATRQTRSPGTPSPRSRSPSPRRPTQSSICSSLHVSTSCWSSPKSIPPRPRTTRSDCATASQSTAQHQVSVELY